MSDFLATKSLCDVLVKNPLSASYAKQLLTKLEVLADPQFSQDYFLTHLLILVDSNLQQRNEIELKTNFIRCINKVLERTKITKELSYMTLLLIVLRTCYDVKNNCLKENLSEEFKISVMDCFTLASRSLDSDIVETALDKNNKKNITVLLQCIFVCTEMIEKEKFRSLRLTAIKAIESLMQTHIDPEDIVLREHVSQTIFIIFPKIVTVLIKITQEETIKGPSLVAQAIRSLGSIICLILEDYKKLPEKNIEANDFLELLEEGKKDNLNDVLGIMTKDKEQYFTNAQKSNEWILAASEKLRKPLEILKRVRGSPHSTIRLELSTLSSLLIEKCLPNIQCFAPFLLENLILLSDDEDKKIQLNSQKALERIFSRGLSTNNLKSQLFNMFSSHLSVMPRAIHMGDDCDQLAALTLLNGYINFISKSSSINALFECQAVLDKLMNVLLNCCELDMQSKILLHEQLSQDVLYDEFYQMKMPWKSFKNMKNDKIVLKMKAVCQNIGNSSMATTVINFLMDNVDSVEYLVLLNEIVAGMEKNNIKDVYEIILEEFSEETYWTMPHIHKEITKNYENDTQLEEWYEDKTLGLYESGIEIRLKGVSLESDDHQKSPANTTLNEIKYNILCTCLVLEMVANLSKIIPEAFQMYHHKLLHRILMKAGSSNFCISNAGLFTLESIATGLSLPNVGVLITQNLDFLLYNIEKKLKNNSEVDHILDIVSVVFKFGNDTMTSHTEKIVQTILQQMDQLKFGSNVTSYLKLFNFYLAYVHSDEIYNFALLPEKSRDETYKEFLEACTDDLKPNIIEEEDQMEGKETEESDEQPEELPKQVTLVLSILHSSIQYLSSKSQVENILVLEIFINGLPILQNYQESLLPLVHQLWYPFTRQFTGQNLVVLQKSFNLLILIAQLAKDFIHKKVLDDIIPVLNTFLISCLKSKDQTSSIWTQKIKLQNNILSNYGSLIVDSEMDERQADGVLDILFKFQDDDQVKSLNFEKLMNNDPTLYQLKKKFLN